MKLEKENFKINSKGWKTVNGVKQNKEGDVWEIIKGEFKGEQLFTWDTAIRETKKAGKRMPTKEEWNKEYTGKIPDFPMVGYRDFSNGSLTNQGAYGYYWSCSVTGTNAFSPFFYSGGVNPADYNFRADGFSVRCVKDCKDEMHNQNEENSGFCFSCQDTIKVKKLSTKYEISNGENSIQVKVREDGNITIRTGRGNSQFKFENSNPEMVRKIAELIIKATNLK
jgi:hypothetical protein